MTTRLRTIFLIGLALSLGLVARSQVGGDQWNLLARGWLLAARGVWIQYGNPTSAGGNEPGGLTSLLIALPLWVWMNHHAPTLLVLLTHVIAYALLDDVVRQTVGARERQLFAVIYWLNPWRLYFSAHLWNPNFLFLAGAIHVWTAYRQRDRARFPASFAHVATIGFACQLHPSAIVLAFASGWLVWKRGLRLHVAGAVLALIVVLVSLVPWIYAAAADPGILPISRGFIGRGLVFVFPLARGLLFWIRYASLSVSGASPFDFTAIVGAPIDPWLAPAITIVVATVTAISAVPSLLANRWTMRRAWRRRHRAVTGSSSGRHWLEAYASAVLAATILTFCLAPTTVMFWQGLVVFHAAVLPLVLWLGALLRTRHARLVRVGMRAATAAAVILVAIMAAASPNYRCGGRDGDVIVLKQNYPMIHDLHVDATCHVPIDVDTGWAPDVFRARD